MKCLVRFTGLMHIDSVQVVDVFSFTTNVSREIYNWLKTYSLDIIKLLKGWFWSFAVAWNIDRTKKFSKRSTRPLLINKSHSVLSSAMCAKASQDYRSRLLQTDIMFSVSPVSVVKERQVKTRQMSPSPTSLYRILHCSCSVP